MLTRSAELAKVSWAIKEHSLHRLARMYQPPFERRASKLKSKVAKALATLVGLCGAGLLVSAGLGLYHLLDSPRPWHWELLDPGGLSIIGAVLIVIAFRTFVRPTPAILRRVSGVIGFLLFVVLLVAAGLVFAPLARLLGDTWRWVLTCVVGVVAYFPAVFLHNRLATFLTREASPSHEKPSDQNET